MAEPSMTQVLRSKRKRKLEEDKATLQLVLQPPSVPAKKRRLGAHPRFHADDRNCVVGSVNGI